MVQSCNNLAPSPAVGQCLGEHPGVATFVAGGVGIGAADDAVSKLAQGRFNGQQLSGGHHTPFHTVLSHQRGSVTRCIKRLHAGVVLHHAVFQPMVVDAGRMHHALQRLMAASARRCQLLHIALGRRVMALPQKLQLATTAGKKQATVKTAAARPNWTSISAL